MQNLDFIISQFDIPEGISANLEQDEKNGLSQPLSKSDFITIRKAYEQVRKDSEFLSVEQQVVKLLAQVAPAHQERAKQFLFCVLHGLDPSQIFIIETGGLKCYLISYANRVIKLLRLEVPIYRT